MPRRKAHAAAALPRSLSDPTLYYHFDDPVASAAAALYASSAAVQTNGIKTDANENEMAFMEGSTVLVQPTNNFPPTKIPIRPVKKVSLQQVALAKEHKRRSRKVPPDGKKHTIPVPSPAGLHAVPNQQQQQQTSTENLSPKKLVAVSTNKIAPPSPRPPIEPIPEVLSAHCD